MIMFQPKFKDSDPNNEFSLVLSKKQNYDTVRDYFILLLAHINYGSQMAMEAGEHLRHDPMKLRFTTTHPTTGQPKMVLKKSLNQSISEIISSSCISAVILYEKLDFSIVDLETKRSIKITWTGIYNKEEGSHAFLVPKTSMMHDIADHLLKVVTLSSGGSGKIRIFEISKDGKTQKEFTGSEMIGDIPDPNDLYAEVR